MKKRLIKILAWFTGSIFSLLVLSVLACAIAFSWLGSEYGRRWIAAQISERASTAEYQIEVGDIETLNNRHVALSYLRLSDQNGELSVLKDIALDYNIEALLAGQIHIDSLDIEEIFVKRLPEQSARNEPQSILPAIPNIKIETIRIKTIVLDQSLTGKVEKLTLEGRLILSPALTGSALELHVMDKISGQEFADLVFGLGGKEEIRLQTHIQDTGKGLISRLTGLPSVNIDIGGTGTAEDWQGKMALGIGEDLNAAHQMSVDLSGKNPVITIEGQSRYDDFIMLGKTIITIQPETEQLDIAFSGQLTTPDVVLDNLNVRLNIKPENNILRGRRPFPAKTHIEGNARKIMPAQTGLPVKELENASFSIDGRITETDFQIEKSLIKTALLTSAIKGAISFDKPNLHLESTVTIPALEKIYPDVTGTATVAGVLRGTYHPLFLQAPVTVKAEKLSTSWPVINDTIGETPELKAALSYENEKLTISDGVLSALHLKDTVFLGAANENAQDFKISTVYQGYKIASGVKHQDNIISFESMSVQSGDLSVTGKGVFNIKEQTLQADLSLKPKDEMNLSLALSGSVSKLNAKGAWEGSGAYPYKFDYSAVLNTQDTINLVIERFAGDYGPNVISLKKKSTILYEGDAAKIQGLEVGLNDGEITASGSFGTDNFKLDLNADNIPANLEAFPFVFDGRIDGTVSANGSYNAPIAEGAFDLKRITIPGLTETDDRYVEGKLTARYQDGQITAQTDLKGPAGLLFKADGKLPLILSPLNIPFDKAVSANLDSSVDLKAVTRLLGLDEQRISGRTDLNVTLGGTLNKPDIKGTGVLKDGVYENLVTGTYFRDITAVIEGNVNSLNLKSFTGKDRNGGHFSGAGKVTLKNIRDPQYELSLDANKLQLVNLDRIGLMASGKINSQGDKDAASVKGNIIINHAEYYVSEIISSNPLSNFEVIETNGHDMSPEATQVNGKGPEIALEIGIEANNNTFVRGPDLETEWNGKLAVSGTADNLLLKGNMALIRGRFQLLDTPVALTKGDVRFVNPDPINPDIDVRGTIKGRDMDAILKITGEAQTPEVSLTSEPPLPEDEILAKTLFGKSVSQLTPMQALRIAQLMAYLSGQKTAGFDPLSKMRQAIGLDTLSVSMDENKGATLSAGKYINDRVYIGVDQGVTPESSAVRAEIDVTEKIEVETITGAGESSLGVNWKHDY